MIKVRDLWKSYGKLEVLKGLDIDINDGETVVILGRSGVGKSVLLRQIIAIETPDKGYVEVNGVNITSLPQSKRERFTKDIGMLFQSGALFDSMNVEENVAFFLTQHEPQLSYDEVSERVRQALEHVNMDGTQKKMPSELSGGMRKRAALARLIIYRPKILLYDEPTTGLDPITAENINILINKIKNELNSTGIVVTHDIKSALEVGDRLAFHDNGKIVAIAPKKEFLQLENPKLQEFLKNSIISPEMLNNHKRSN